VDLVHEPGAEKGPVQPPARVDPDPSYAVLAASLEPVLNRLKKSG
jgi:hypothetical protein